MSHVFGFGVLVVQIRYPVLLTPTEKEIARLVCLAFGQLVTPHPPYPCPHPISHIPHPISPIL